jgi:CRP/FNR family transcriptional regulator
MSITLQFLKEISLFQYAKESELLLLAKNLTRHVYLKNETLFQEGSKAERLYMVLQGQIKICKFSKQGKEYILDILTKYQLFGEVPMFSGTIYPAHAIAVTDAIVFSLDREKLINLIKQNPQVALNFLALQAARLREFNNKIEQLSLQKVEQNLIDYLQNKKRIELLSMQNLANSLGVSRETLSRTISQLIKSGKLKKENSRLKLTGNLSYKA